MSGLLLGAAAAGLLGSPHCVGMCGGFAVAVAERPRESAAWHAGRFATYASLGALAGASGAAVPGPPWLSAALSVLLLLWFSARLAGLLPEAHGHSPTLARWGGRLLARRDALGRFGFGMTTGLLPCGLVYAALAVPVALAHPGWGALAMVAFGLGTTPALLAASVSLRGLTHGRPWVRRALAAAVLVAGLSSVASRALLH